jgi:hypothetical protein
MIEFSARRFKDGKIIPENVRQPVQTSGLNKSSSNVGLAG